MGGSIALGARANPASKGWVYEVGRRIAAEIDALFSFAGVHPNNAGHARIADLFWSCIVEDLRR